MTWPFENDTSAVVKRLSNRNIAANRKRNIFIVLTVALASALLSAIVFMGLECRSKHKTSTKKQHRLYITLFLNNRDRSCIAKKKLRGLGNFLTHFLNRLIIQPLILLMQMQRC